MGFYRNQVLPRLMDRAMAKADFAELREKYLGRVSGRVLELGFGSGHNLLFYSSEVTQLLAVDPAVVGRKLANKRLASVPFPVDFIGLDGASLALPDDSVDWVVSTWTLCTIADVEVALAETRRVLKPTGRLLFLEHGRSDRAAVARWQDRLNPLQKMLGGGCHLNRRIDHLIAAAGLTIEGLENFTMRGPATHTFMYAGEAGKGVDPSRSIV